MTDKIDGAVTINYDCRYDNLDIYDAVISATSSPHLTLEKTKTATALKTQKIRAFIDLAVPRDIEVAESEYTVYNNIDDLLEIAENNNRIKLQELDKAKEILKKYIDEFRIWKIFTENKQLFKNVENKIENDGEKKLFRHKIYDIKAENNYEKFCVFLKTLKEKEYEH